MKRFFVLTFLFFTFGNPIYGESLQDKFANPPVPSYLVVNVDTGDIIIQKEPELPHAPASLAKMMTMYLVLDAIKEGKIHWNDSYTVPKRISTIVGSRARLWPGEKISIHDLFIAMVIGSANDGAAALAEITSGSQDAFVQAMNQKAAELGLAHTHYRSPHGLPAPEGAVHDFTTAVDLANLALALIQNHPEVLQFTGLKQAFIRQGKWRFINTNKLIGKFEGIHGLKTGFTNEAGYCLVATAKRGNLTLISVLLGAQSNKDRFKYTAQLLGDSFARFTNVNISCKGKTFDVPIPESDVPSDQGVTTKDLFFMAQKDLSNRLELELFIPSNLKAPIPQGQKIAEYIATADGKILARVDVYAKDEIKRAGFFKRHFGW